MSIPGEMATNCEDSFAIVLLSSKEYPRRDHHLLLFSKMKRDRSFLPVSAISLLDYSCRAEYIITMHLHV